MSILNRVFCIICLVASLISCKNEDDDCCMVVDTSIVIKYVNNNSESILNKPEGLPTSDIKVYHKIDGQWVEYYESNLDFPEGFSVRSVGEEDFLVLYPSLNFFNGNYSETKIEFSENDADIVKAQFNLSTGNTICSKVWYDNELKWEQLDGGERAFTVIK